MLVKCVFLDWLCTQINADWSFPISSEIFILLTITIRKLAFESATLSGECSFEILLEWCPMSLKSPATRPWVQQFVLANIRNTFESALRTNCEDHPWITHYDDGIMTTMESQITSLTVVYSTVYSDADQRKHQSSASLAFVWGIHRDRWIPCTKGQLRGKCFHLMTSSCVTNGQYRKAFPCHDVVMLF